MLTHCKHFWCFCRAVEVAFILLMCENEGQEVTLQMSLMMQVSLHMCVSLRGEKGAEHPSQDVALRQQAEASPGPAVLPVLPRCLTGTYGPLTSLTAVMLFTTSCEKTLRLQGSPRAQDVDMQRLSGRSGHIFKCLNSHTEPCLDRALTCIVVNERRLTK